MTQTPFAVNVPINSVSFGNVSVAILREIRKLGLTPSIIPIGPVDLSTQKQDYGFNQWLQGCLGSSQQRHSRDWPTLKLWHIQGALESVSKHSNDLLTFFELDSLQPSEINILNQQRNVLVTSRFTQSVFAQFGVKSSHIPLGFDSHNFHMLDKRPGMPGVISMAMFGKWEKRKQHPKILRLWAQKYGNKKEYRLNCFVHNPFLRLEDFNSMIGQALDGKQYFNIQFHPWSASNEEYNTSLQSSQIVFALSGGEGYDLPVYHAASMGAWPVGIRAHVYNDYLDDNNAVLINPNSKTRAADGVFFHENSQFNVGNLFDFSDEDFYAATAIAESRVKSLGINANGIKLQENTYSATTQKLLTSMGIQ